MISLKTGKVCTYTQYLVLYYTRVLILIYKKFLQEKVPVHKQHYYKTGLC